MKYYLIKLYFILIVNVLLSYSVPIEVVAKLLGNDSSPLNATATVLETKQKYNFNSDGSLKFDYPAGEPLTLLFNADLTIPTQSATVIVPQNGLTGANNLTYQALLKGMLFALNFTFSEKEASNSCHLIVTVFAPNKTIFDNAQGIAGVKLKILDYNKKELYFKVNYLGIYENGPFKGKTNIFQKGLSETSDDGGVYIANIPATTNGSNYYVTAVADGKNFTMQKIICFPDRLINLSPPYGITTLETEPNILESMF